MNSNKNANDFVKNNISHFVDSTVKHTGGDNSWERVPRDKEGMWTKGPAGQFGINTHEHIGDSPDKHTDRDGNLTPERRKLHERIVFVM
ncbi:MAG: hypothetical protein ABI416_03735 [Ginsengibacter sp.]